MEERRVVARCKDLALVLQFLLMLPDAMENVLYSLISGVLIYGSALVDKIELLDGVKVRPFYSNLTV